MRLWIILLLTYASCTNAKQALHAKEAKQKLSNLQQKIVMLEDKLSRVNDKQALVNRELHFNDKAISECALDLRSITQKLTSKEHKIANLIANNKKLLQEYQNNQKLLSKYIVALYHFRPLQIIDIKKQENTIRSANDMHRIINYYKSLVSNRLSIMEALVINRALVAQQTRDIQLAVNKQRNLKTKLIKYEKKLLSQKQYQTALVNSLIKEYKNNRQALRAAQLNKENLESILTRLAKENSSKPQVRSAVLVENRNLYEKNKFIWPITAGKRAISNTKQGILIQAKEGMPVRAANSGKVVFSAWLKGYGMLIIIDHGNNLMTLYGHNQALFKKPGDQVFAGEQIAIVGNSGGVIENGLYFEVRHRGKAVAPTQWLHTV